ncbi:hypothetical protein BH11BAC5_BH11BAC5_36700 [soil metagenome]
MKEYYGTLSQTINGLKKEGYTMDFNIHEEYLAHHQADTTLSPGDFEINEIFRFGGNKIPMISEYCMPFLRQSLELKVCRQMVMELLRM